MEKNRNNHSALQGNPVAMRKTIGKITYLVRVHFNDDATENMQEMIKRLIARDIKQKAV